MIQKERSCVRTLSESCYLWQSEFVGIPCQQAGLLHLVVPLHWKPELGARKHFFSCHSISRPLLVWRSWRMFSLGHLSQEFLHSSIISYFTNEVVVHPIKHCWFEESEVGVLPKDYSEVFNWSKFRSNICHYSLLGNPGATWTGHDHVSSRESVL